MFIYQCTAVHIQWPNDVNDFDQDKNQARRNIDRSEEFPDGLWDVAKPNNDNAVNGEIGQRFGDIGRDVGDEDINELFQDWSNGVNDDDTKHAENDHKQGSPVHVSN